MLSNVVSFVLLFVFYLSRIYLLFFAPIVLKWLRRILICVKRIPDLFNILVFFKMKRWIGFNYSLTEEQKTF